MPKISIVLPTKDRSHLIENSVIPTLTRQTYDDYEIIICDNASSDNTPNIADKLIQQYGNLIKYERTDNWIPKEKFFQWSMDKAEGKYLTLFFDDDVLTSNALKKIDSIDEYDPKNEIITYSRSMCYFYDDYPDINRQNLLVIPPFSGQVWKYNSLNHLKLVFERNEIFRPSPMVSNAFYSTELYRRVSSKYGDLYPHGHMGDYNICCFMLSETENFYYLDDPVAIFGQWSKNTSAQLHDLHTTMDEYSTWIKEFSDKYLKSMPWKHYLWPNCVCAALNQTANIINLDLKVDNLNYLRTINEEIGKFEGNENMKETVNVMKKDLVNLAKECLDPKKVNLIYEMDSLLPAHGHIDGEEKINNLTTKTHFDFPKNLWHEINGEENFNTIKSSVDYFESIVGDTSEIFLNKNSFNGIKNVSGEKYKNLAKKILPNFIYKPLGILQRKVYGVNLPYLHQKNIKFELVDFIEDILTTSVLNTDEEFKAINLFKNNSYSWHSSSPFSYPQIINIKFKYPLIFSKLVLVPQLKSPEGESFLPRAPKRLKIKSGTNGTDWVTIGDVDLGLKYNTKKENQKFEIKFDTSIKTKYLRIIIEENFGDANLISFNRLLIF